MVGYWLTGLKVEHKFWVCFGHGRNGKGVLLNTLRAVMGDYAGTAARDTFHRRLRIATADQSSMVGAWCAIHAKFWSHSKSLAVRRRSSGSKK